MATESELRNMTAALSNVVGGYTNTVRNLDASLQGVSEHMKQENAARKLQIDVLGKSTKSEKQIREEGLNLLKAEVQKRSQAVDDLSAQLPKLRDATRKQIDEIRTMQVQMKRLETARLAAGETNLSEQEKKLQEQIKLRKDEVAAARATADSLKKQRAAFSSELSLMTESLQEQRAAMETQQRTAMQMITQSLKEQAKKMTKAFFDPSKLGQGFRGALDITRQSMDTAADYSLASPIRTQQLATMGVSEEQYSQMNAAYRTQILAMGGAEKQIDLWSKNLSKVRGNFGTLGDATIYTQQQMGILANAGVKPTARQLGGLAKSFTDLQKLTGMTGKEFNGLIESYTEDADVRAQLRTMDQRQRYEMLQGLALRAKENVAMGISIQQTLDMAKNMAKLDKETYKERNTRAARVQGLTGAIGMNDLGKELARIIRQAPGTRSEVDRRQLEAGYQQIANAAADARGSGNVGREIQMDSLLQALQQENVLGKDSAFNTNQAESLKIADSSREALSTFAQTQSEVPDLMKDSVHLLDAINTSVNTKLALILVGMGGMLAAGKFGKYAVGAAGKIGGKLANTSLGQKVKGAVGKVVESGSRFLPGKGPGKSVATAGTTVAGVADGVATAAAKALPELAPTVAAGTKAATETAGKSVGKSILKKIPILGAIMGAGFAGARLLQGDFTGAGLELASGAASTVPGWGTAASIGLDATIAARDLGAFDSSAKEVAPKMISTALTPPTDEQGKIDAGLTSHSLEELLKVSTDGNDSLFEQVRATTTGNQYLKGIDGSMTQLTELMQQLIEMSTMTEAERARAAESRPAFGGRSVPSFNSTR